jgi:hypothetical protein
MWRRFRDGRVVLLLGILSQPAKAPAITVSTINPAKPQSTK